MKMKLFILVLSIVCAFGFYYLYKLASLCLSAYNTKSNVRPEMVRYDTGALRLKHDTIIQNSY